MINDFLLLLNEFLGLPGAVAVDVSGGEDLLLSEPLHVGSELVRVLVRLPQGVAGLLGVCNFGQESVISWRENNEVRLD